MRAYRLTVAQNPMPMKQGTRKQRMTSYTERVTPLGALRSPTRTPAARRLKNGDVVATLQFPKNRLTGRWLSSVCTAVTMPVSTSGGSGVGLHVDRHVLIGVAGGLSNPVPPHTIPFGGLRAKNRPEKG